MDSNSENVIRLLEMLAACNTKFIHHASLLEKQPEVKEATTRFECRRCGMETLIEGYVDAELQSGKAVCWYLEVRWDANHTWLIDTRILINHAGGQDTGHKFPDRMTSEFNEFLNNLQEATEELISFDGVNLASIESSK
jgi:hypothetical protein